MDCALAGSCGGCPWLTRAVEAQHDAKRAALRAALPDVADVTLVAVGDAGLRDRLDVQIRPDAIGFGALDEGQRIVDVATCPLAIPELDRLLQDLRADRPPVARASARLRIGHDGARGLWLDLAHADVKALLDERAWLARWAATTELELGPKARRVTPDGRLEAPRLRPWTSTTIRNQEVALSCRVADFTQPSRIANRTLVATVMDHAERADAARWLELGAGAGNLTLPLSDLGHVRAVELDGVALQHNLAAHGRQAEVLAASFTRATDVATLVLGRDGILADPPRSGLGPFAEALTKLAPSLRPPALVYVSCHVEALARDAEPLARAGYRATRATAVDQFPHTPHTEWVVTFTR